MLSLIGPNLVKNRLGVQAVPRALDSFSVLADAYPSDATIHFQMANCYERMDDLANALLYYDFCLTADPTATTRAQASCPGTVGASPGT